MKKRTKIIILTVMVLLLGVTGYLNIVLNNSISSNTTTASTTSYFDSYRSDRSSTRDQQLLYYDSIIESESSSEEAIKNAEDAKLSLTNRITQEVEVEGLIRGLGYTDCVISIGQKKTTVIVEGKEMNDIEANKIAAIVADSLDILAKNVVVIPV